MRTVITLNPFLFLVSQSLAATLSCPDILLPPNLVSVNNLTGGVNISITFMIFECGRVEKSIGSVDCLTAEFMGREITYDSLAPCMLNSSPKAFCPLKVTYSTNFSVPWAKRRGIEIWTDGTEISTMSWKCDLNQSFFYNIFGAVKDTFAEAGKVGKIFPLAVNSVKKTDYSKYLMLVPLIGIILLALVVGDARSLGKARCFNRNRVEWFKKVTRPNNRN